MTSVNVSQHEIISGESFETTTLWIISCFSYIIMAFVVSKGKPFRKPLYTNYLHSLLLIAQIAVFLFLTFTNNQAVQTALQLACTPMHWRISLMVMLLFYFAAVYSVEEYIIDNRKFWLALKKYLKQKPKSKFKILQRSLEKDPNWPPLNVIQYTEPIDVQLESKIGLLQTNV